MYIITQQLTVPIFLKCTILKNNNKYIYFLKNDKTFLWFEIKKQNTKIYKNTTGFLIKNEYLAIQSAKTFLQYITNNIIKSWEIYFYKKFKFKSKGLKIKRKKKNILKFFFWLSHINLAVIKNCKIKRIGKQKYIFINSNWVYLKKICQNMRDVRPNDLFTKKGIRFGRQIILKKRGKKVTYI